MLFQKKSNRKSKPHNLIRFFGYYFLKAYLYINKKLSGVFTSTKKNNVTKLNSDEFFKSIHDCPIKVWFDIHKTSDCIFLLKNRKKISVKETNYLWSVWEEIYNEYINEFGLSEEFLTDLNNQIELANYKAEFVITGERYLRTLIRVQEERIKMFNKDNSKPANLEMLLAKMSKHYGFKLSSRELTISEYYSYLNNASND